MIRRILGLATPVLFALAVGGCVVAPGPGYYAPRPAYASAYVAPRPYYRPYGYRPYYGRPYHGRPHGHAYRW